MRFEVSRVNDITKVDSFLGFCQLHVASKSVVAEQNRRIPVSGVG
jgi:hypothetical protein